MFLQITGTCFGSLFELTFGLAIALAIGLVFNWTLTLLCAVLYFMLTVATYIRVKLSSSINKRKKNIISTAGKVSKSVNKQLVFWRKNLIKVWTYHTKN